MKNLVKLLLEGDKNKGGVTEMVKWGSADEKRLEDFLDKYGLVGVVQQLERVCNAWVQDEPSHELAQDWEHAAKVFYDLRKKLPSR